MKRTVLSLFVLISALIVAAPMFAQPILQPTNVWFPHIDVGGDPNGIHYVTLVQASNNTSSFLSGHLVVYSDAGSAMSVSFDGGAPATSLDFGLDSGVTRQIQISASGAITAGWVQITYTPNIAETTVILQNLSGSSVLTEVGINPAYGVMASTDFPVETDANLNTGIAIAAPNGASVVLAQLLTSGGAVAASTTLSLAANAHVAKLLTDLFPTVAGITQTRTQLVLTSCTTTACTAAGPGFIATALRLNLANNSFTAIPVTSSPSTLSTRVIPHIAFGGSPSGLNFQTVLYLTNASSSNITGAAANMFDDNGNPIAASANGGTLSSTFTFSVAAGTVSKIVLSGTSTLQAGWIALTIPTGTSLIVNAVFQTYSGASLVSEASVLESPPQTEGLIYVNVQPGVTNVGVALANPQSSVNPVTLTLYNQAGFVFATQTVNLPAFGHLARYITDIFPQLAGTSFTGTLSMQSGLGFSAVALRQNGTSVVGFAALPVAVDIMFIPSVTNVQVTSTNRTTGVVNFTVTVVDYSPNLVTPTSTIVSAAEAVVYTSQKNAQDGYYSFSLDGTALINAQSGNLTGAFQGRQTVPISSGTPAQFFIAVQDALGNYSNVIGVNFKW